MSSAKSKLRRTKPPRPRKRTTMPSLLSGSSSVPLSAIVSSSPAADSPSPPSPGLGSLSASDAFASSAATSGSGSGGGGGGGGSAESSSPAMRASTRRETLSARSL